MKDREITPNVLDRLIAVAEENITKTRVSPGRIWFNRSDRIREMQQTTQALKEFREVMQDRDRLQAALLRHGVHDDTCDVEIHGPDTCNCGFDAACFPSK